MLFTNNITLSKFNQHKESYSILHQILYVIRLHSIQLYNVVSATVFKDFNLQWNRYTVCSEI